MNSQLLPCAKCGALPRTKCVANPYRGLLGDDRVCVEEYYCQNCLNKPMIDKWNAAQRKAKESEK